MPNLSLLDGGHRRVIFRDARGNDGENMVDTAVGRLGIRLLPALRVRPHSETDALLPSLENFATVPVELHALAAKCARLLAGSPRRELSRRGG